jgi:hypothetical protein
MVPVLFFVAARNKKWAPGPLYYLLLVCNAGTAPGTEPDLQHSGISFSQQKSPDWGFCMLLQPEPGAVSDARFKPALSVTEIGFRPWPEPFRRPEQRLADNW